jgi:hypothetical protein
LRRYGVGFTHKLLVVQFAVLSAFASSIGAQTAAVPPSADPAAAVTARPAAGSEVPETGATTAAPRSQAPDQPLGLTDYQRTEIVREVERIPKPPAEDKTTTPAFEPVIKWTPLKSRLFAPIVWGCEDEWKLQIAGDWRVRAERRDNWNMNDDIDLDDDLVLMRTRLNFELTRDTFFRAFLGLLDARQFGVLEGTDPLQEDHVDIQQLFVELRPENQPWWVRVGRWIPPAFGSSRHIDYGNWSNLVNTWQGVLFDYEQGDLDLHLYLAQQLDYVHRHNDVIRTGRMSKRDHEWLYGAYATLHQFRPHKLDVYFLGQSDLDRDRTFPSSNTNEKGRIGSLDRYTVGTYLRGPVCEEEGFYKLRYGIEPAFQFGQRAGDDIKAAMLHADLYWEFEHEWKPLVQLVGNLATGDKDPNDGETNRFVQYPSASNHSPYGIIDLTRLSNLRHIGLVGKIEPQKDLKVQLEAHKFWLDSPKDSWVGASGRDQTGRSGRDIGRELDLIISKKVNDCLTVEFGAARYWPGGFSKRNGRPDAANFVYLQTVYSF